MACYVRASNSGATSAPGRERVARASRSCRAPARSRRTSPPSRSSLRSRSEGLTDSCHGGAPTGRRSAHPARAGLRAGGEEDPMTRSGPVVPAGRPAAPAAARTVPRARRHCPRPRPACRCSACWSRWPSGGWSPRLQLVHPRAAAAEAMSGRSLNVGGRLLPARAPPPWMWCSASCSRRRRRADRDRTRRLPAGRADVHAAAGGDQRGAEDHHRAAAGGPGRLGAKPILTMVFLLCFFPIVLATATGLTATPADLAELARSLDASRLADVPQGAPPGGAAADLRRAEGGDAAGRDRRGDRRVLVRQGVWATSSSRGAGAATPWAAILLIASSASCSTSCVVAGRAAGPPLGPGDDLSPLTRPAASPDATDGPIPPGDRPVVQGRVSRPDRQRPPRATSVVSACGIRPSGCPGSAGSARRGRPAATSPARPAAVPVGPVRRTAGPYRRVGDQLSRASAANEARP